jgi:hypothetical protein
LLEKNLAENVENPENDWRKKSFFLEKITAVEYREN